MDNMENQEEMQEKDDFNEDSENGKAKQWFRDNLRIIVSILIVVVIAGGIYSYSNRSVAPTITDDQNNSVLSEKLIWPVWQRIPVCTLPVDSRDSSINQPARATL